MCDAPLFPNEIIWKAIKREGCGHAGADSHRLRPPWSELVRIPGRSRGVSADPYRMSCRLYNEEENGGWARTIVLVGRVTAGSYVGRPAFKRTFNVELLVKMSYK